MTRKSIFIFLFLILAVGTALRTATLTREGLWLDEGISAWLAQQSTEQIIENRSSDVHPPLYFIFLKGWVSLFGNSEASLRTPSLLAGILSILLLFLIARRVFNAESGLFAALIFALSPLHLYFSQEARSYALTLLWGLLSLCFALRFFQKPSFLHAIGLVFFQTLCIYFHFSGFFFLAAVNLFFVIFWLRHRAKTPWKSWIASQAATLALFFPWLKILLSQAGRVKSGFWIPVPDLRILSGSFLEFFGSWSFFLFLILGSLLAIFFALKKSSRNSLSLPFKNFRVLIWIWLVCPWICALLLSWVLSPVFNTRMVLSSSLALYILAAWVLSSLRFRKIWALILVAFSFEGVYHYQTSLHKEQWKEAAEWLKQETRPGDLVLTHANYCKIYVLDYYYHEKNITSLPFPLIRKEENLEVKHLQELASLAKDQTRIWLVYSHAQYHDPQQEIFRFLKKWGNGTVQKEHHFAHIQIYLFTKTSP